MFSNHFIFHSKIALLLKRCKIHNLMHVNILVLLSWICLGFNSASWAFSGGRCGWGKKCGAFSSSFLSSCKSKVDFVRWEKQSGWKNIRFRGVLIQQPPFLLRLAIRWKPLCALSSGHLRTTWDLAISFTWPPIQTNAQTITVVTSSHGATWWGGKPGWKRTTPRPGTRSSSSPTTMRLDGSKESRCQKRLDGTSTCTKTGSTCSNGRVLAMLSVSSRGKNYCT